VITKRNDAMSTLDIDTVQAFVLVAELQSFTRTAEALGTTQAAVSLKLQRLESVLGKRLVERSPRAVTLTADGSAFLQHARVLMEAHDRALSGEAPTRQRLSLGISDHAAGPELVPLLERLHAMSSQLSLSVTIGFSRAMLDAYDSGELDAVVVRQEGSRRGGENLTEDAFGWFAAPRFVWPRCEALQLATPRAPLWRARDRGPRTRQGRDSLERSLCRRRPHRRGRRRPGRTGGRAPRPPNRAGGAGRDRDSAEAADTWYIKGDVTLEGQRSRQTRGAADIGGDFSERGYG
jgi:DNA-binding transcriptional LysR family regulator